MVSKAAPPCFECQKRQNRLASWRLEIGGRTQFAESAPRICREIERDIAECCGDHHNPKDTTNEQP